MHIFIASHKYSEFPVPSGYVPLFVGASKLPDNDKRLRAWRYDDSYAENISTLNALFCELTGLHYIWKQCNDEIVGLVHYRRFLGEEHASGVYAPLDEKAVKRGLSSHDCIVADRAPVLYGDYSITVAEQYRLCHVSTDLIQARFVIAELFPDYIPAFDEVMHDSGLHPCNILICRKPLFDDYCLWLFSIMRELYRRLDVVARKETYQKRAFGFLAERLLNVYLRKNNLRATTFPVFDPAESGVRAALDYGLVLPQRPRLPAESQSKSFYNPEYLGRSFAPVYNFEFYLNHNPDLFARYSKDPEGAFRHFINHGLNEGRMGSPTFHIQSYIHGNRHLWKRFDDSNRLAYVLHFLDCPLDRNHAIGFENITVEKKKLCLGSIAPTKLMGSCFKRKMLKRAERYGVID